MHQRTTELCARELQHIDGWLELARLAEEDSGPLHYPLTHHRQLYLSQRAWLMDNPASSLPHQLRFIINDAIRQESREKVTMPRLSHQEPGTRNANPSLDWADEVDQHIYSVTRQAPGLPPPLRDFSSLRSSSRNPWSSLNFRRRRTLHIKQPMPPIPMFTYTVHNSQSRPPRPHYPASFNNSPHHLYPDHPFPSNRHPSFPGCNCRCHLDHPSRSHRWASGFFSCCHHLVPPFLRSRRLACGKGVYVPGKPGMAGQVLSTRGQWQESS